MPKYPSEVFGYPLKAVSGQARTDRKKYRCPFADQKCNKQSRLISYPMGVCSVRYGQETVALCPRRFLQDNTVFTDIADHYFGTRSDLLIFSEVGLPDIGMFDYVMVKHKPMSNDIEDFVVIEFQTGQTTGTGELVKGLKDFVRGEDVEGRNYGFGLNLADIWKRTFTQILNKGIVLEHWGHKIYWVIQEPVYRDFLNRYNLNQMGYQKERKTVFMIYDLKSGKDLYEYEMVRTRIEASTTDALFNAFRNNPNIPSKDAFLGKLKTRLEDNMSLKLCLDRSSSQGRKKR